MTFVVDPATDPVMELARQALQQYPIKAADISLLARAENISFKVADESGELYTLRLHRPAYHTLEELKSERMWTKALLQAGIHVPEPISTRDGRDHVDVDIPQLGEHRYASLSRWAPGEPLMRLIREGHSQAQLEMYFRKLGGLIATMNNQATQWHPPAEFKRHALDADGLMGTQPFWGKFWERSDLSRDEQALLLDTRVQLHGLFTRYGMDKSRYSVIHSDLHPGNALVDGDTLTAIDFDDVAWGWHMYDLAAALNQCQELAEFGAFQAACLGGYCHVRPVSDEDVAMLPMFLLARDLAEIGWFAARPENATPAQMAAMKNFVVARCRDFLGGRLAPFAVVQG